jgi:hypothetical protein
LAPLPSLARVTFFKKINEDQEWESAIVY